MTQNGSDRKDIAGINEGNHSRPHLIVFFFLQLFVNQPL